jgi:DNA-binding transcriptional regulator of glucitol operon
MSILSDYWDRFQVSLFPRLEVVLDEPLTEKLKKLVRIFDVVGIEQYVASPFAQWMGRKQVDRRSMARAFLAKAVYDLPTTELLIEMLRLQPTLRRLCGFEYQRDIPSASTFSRAFGQFATAGLGDRVHEALVKEHVGEKVVMHVSRDSTEVSAREKPAKKVEVESKPKRKPGRPKKGEQVPPKEPTRLVKQLDQSPEEAIAELPRVCNVGSKKDSKGNSHSWTGWKAHIDWADGGVPLNVLTTSASLHDSQVAIPMARVTAARATSLYDLMDSAYDAEQIHKVSQELGHVALIDPNPRRGNPVPWDPDRLRRYNQRSTAERGNSRLKDEFGLRHLRVRGHSKAHLHIMFGVLALFADALRQIFSG